ncbi:ATP-binding cassette domain-containing protein [Levilactobacillus sp. N40-8-2]|uniref:ATP-binding cassette domain-containing protein n=1 Tax=Levilactobacillus muriae TaxID=3238987 RepID=UPI0038B2E13B
MFTAISLENVSKKYKNRQIFNAINMTINSGEVVGISGPNGSGKTTLLKLILGLTPPTSGIIKIEKKKLDSKNLFAENTGFSFKEFGPLNNYSGLNNLKIIGQLKKKGPDVPFTHPDNLMKLVGLDPNNAAKVKTYSLGMRQRLSIAMSLINNPKIVIWDEPENSLDNAGKILLQELLSNLISQEKTIVMTSHDQEFLTHNTNTLFEVTAGRLQLILENLPHD